MTEPCAAPAFTLWLDDVLASFWRHRPVTATYAGVHAYDDRLPDYSEHGVGRRPGRDPDAADPAGGPARQSRSRPWKRSTAARPRDSCAPSSGSTTRRTSAGPTRACTLARRSSGSSAAAPGADPDPESPGAGDRPPGRDPGPAGRRPEQSIRSAPAAWIERARRESAAASCCWATAWSTYLAQHGQDAPTRCAALPTGRSERSRLRSVSGAGSAAVRHRPLRLRRRRLRDAAARRPLPGHGCGWPRSESAGADRAGRIGPGGPAQHGSGPTDWRAALDGLADVHPTAEQFPGRFPELWAESRAAVRQHDLVTLPDWPVVFAPQPAWVKAAAPAIYFIPYRYPAPLDRPAGGVQYIPTMPERSRRAGAAAARHQRAGHQAELHRASLGHRAPHPELVRHAGHLADRADRGGGRRLADRHALRRHAGRGLGLLRHRPDGRDRVPDAAGELRAASTRSFGWRPARSWTCACTRPVLAGRGPALLRGAGRDVARRVARRGGQEQPLPGDRLHVPGRLGRYPAAAARRWRRARAAASRGGGSTTSCSRSARCRWHWSPRRCWLARHRVGRREAA